MTRRSRSLRGRLFVLMAVIALVECVVLMLTIVLSGVFTQLDAEAFRLLENDALERALALDDVTGRLIQNTTNAASALSEEAQAIASARHAELTDAYRNDALYNELASRCSDYLVEFLNGNQASAAFFILNGSNTDQNDPSAHSAVYIRNTAPGVTDAERRNLQLEVGPIAVARDYRITAADRWELHMNLDEAEDSSFYTNPIAACEEFPKSELVRYGYWSRPTVILPGNQECISYTLPILDASGIPWGVMGFEITLSYFETEFLSGSSLPYRNTLLAIVTGAENKLDTSLLIAGGPATSTYLAPDETLDIRPVEGTESYETDIAELGEVYCAVHELTMYSRNSPFVNERWLLTEMVQQEVLSATSTGIGQMLLMTMAITLGVSFLAIFLLSWLSTRKIVGLSQYINELGPGSDIKFVRTDLREIDDLTSAVERLNRRINDSMKVTSKMMELTQLPLGGFEVSNDLDTVMLTEYIYELLHLEQGEPVTKDEWRQMYAELTAHPADGYAHVYRYSLSKIQALGFGGLGTDANEERDSEDLYTYADEPDEKQKWLRIIEAPDENGTVGMILDATTDIDEMMRLAHELDYDTLTRLYNRTAFKREAFKKIQRDPNKMGAMIFSDLDNLKSTNDTYGHQMGDRLITTAADMFREFVDYGGIVARISGDEFAIFLYGYTTRDEIMKIISKLYSGYKHRYFTTQDGKKHWISCSSGIAWYPRDSTDVSDLLKLSDYAMYEAKHTRKGTLYEKDGKLFAFDEEAYMESEQARKSRGDLRKLIDDQLVRFRFQPIVDLETGDIYGYEAFMSPLVESFATPGQVLAAARAESMLGELESMLVLKIFSVVQENKDVIGDKKIFVNSVPGQRLSDDDWDVIQQKYKDVIPNIIIEVTEAENDDLDAMLIKLRKIRKVGIPIAIDDFGQGFSNEVRIIAMQPSIIKIDLELIRNLHADPEKQKTVGDLVAFAHQQGVKVSAEGLELEMELETVMRFGIDYAQGYLLGKPVFGFEKVSEPAEEMIQHSEDFKDAGQAADVEAPAEPAETEEPEQTEPEQTEES